MRLLLLAVFVLMFTSCCLYGQDTNSMASSIDSAYTAPQKHSDPDDSIYQARMKRPVHERGKVLDQFLAGYKERQQEERKQRYFRIGLGVVFLSILAYSIIKRSKQQSKNTDN